MTLSKEAVFIARKPEATRHPEEFAPMDHTRSNDELVYSVPVRKHLPSLSFSHALAGKQSLFFECLAMGVSPCLSLCDSGASTSFVSRSYLLRHQTTFKAVSHSARLADGSPLAIVGVVKDLFMKMHGMRARYALVADVPSRRFAHIRYGVGHGFSRAF